MELSEDEYTEAYGLVCNAIERAYAAVLRHPYDPGDLQFLHTSDNARAATNTVFDILGIEMPEELVQRYQDPEYLRSLAAYLEHHAEKPSP